MTAVHIDADVLIIGAGFAGLACAARLRNESKLRVVVCEASEHIGGRCHTVREDELFSRATRAPRSHGGHIVMHAAPQGCARPLGADRFDFELGAEFVHGPTTVLSELLHAHGAKLEKLFTWAHGDGGVQRKPAPDGGIGFYWLGKEKQLMKYDEHIADDELNFMNEYLGSLGDIPEETTARDTRTLLQAMRDAGVSERAMSMAEAGFANTAAGTLGTIGLERIAHTERCYEPDGEGDYRVAGTMAHAAVGALSAGIDIRLGTPVSRVTTRADGSGYEVALRNGESARAKVVVVSASIPALQRKVIDFQPPLPGTKLDAIACIKCEPALKLMLKFSRRPWPANMHGIICADSFVPEIWVQRHTATDGSDDVHYATGFFTADYARRAAALGIDEAVGAFLEQLEAMFGGKPRESYAGGFLVDWGGAPYVWGSYCTAAIGETPEARAALASPVGGTLLWCGEATHPNSFMTAHTAMQTGARAADEAVAALSGASRTPRARL